MTGKLRQTDQKIAGSPEAEDKKRADCPVVRNTGACGGSMLYVILLVTLLSVLSTGYLAVSNYNMKAILVSRSYMEAQLTAKMIHRSFCEAVSSGDSEAMNLVWRRFEEDCDRTQEAFDAMMEEDQEEEDKTDGEPDLSDADPEESRWERYLNQALGNKEYTASGSTSQEKNGPKVDITLTALPLQAFAKVHTQVKCNGYHFSLMADIVFDDRDGAVMTLPNPYRSREAGTSDLKIYLNGNGVCRYYEETSD